MQASGSVMWRALVILFCLVTIPLVAVFGKSLPEILSELTGGRWPLGGATAQASLHGSPRFEPIGLKDSRVAAVGADVRLKGDHPLCASREPGYSPAGLANVAGQPVAASVLAQVQPGPLPAQPAGNAQRAIPSAPATVDRFAHVEGRLRELGATDYLLQSWGNQGVLCRFCCRVAVQGDPHYTRYFEATDTDPVLAMARVLHEVESWRADGG